MIDIKELQDAVQETGHKEIRESKAALRLSNKVDKMISKMDSLLDDLNKERSSLQQQIDDKVKEGVSIGKERSMRAEDRNDIIGINELVLAIRRIQKVSDDTRLQRIADVLEKMDVDHDGAVEIDHVLKVIELLGQDNVKVTPEQMDGIVELLMKEEALELEEKLKREKENSSSEGKSSSEYVCGIATACADGGALFYSQNELLYVLRTEPDGISMTEQLSTICIVGYWSGGFEGVGVSCAGFETWLGDRIEGILSV
ncbi:hypothetical protein CEXT_156361 [Caerostris extrusa]|uniref:EF-hand domain-containing protein n=1 Tax=Caerostris extrusa TaxID=172846 RepID=A0AAV4UIH1_CAEEX|nr:hypothetical protein CEXT_156361 [Caerostris extrusa]